MDIFQLTFVTKKLARQNSFKVAKKLSTVWQNFDHFLVNTQPVFLMLSVAEGCIFAESAHAFAVACSLPPCLETGEIY